MKTTIMKSNSRAIKKAIHVLKNGGVIIYPTETAYGLGVDATNVKAVKKIFEIKKRPLEKKISVIVSSLDMAKRYLRFDKSKIVEKRVSLLVNKFMPGPLTLVVGKNAFRITANKIALSLVRKFGKPITATSANISGKPAIYEINGIKKTFEDKVDLIMDAGNLPRRRLTTVFNVDKMKILRRGEISEKDILKVITH